MADKRFSIQIDVQGNINPIKGSLNELQKVFQGLAIPTQLQGSLDKTFSKLSAEIQNFEAIANKGFTNMGDVSKAEKSFSSILTLFEHLKIQAGQVKGIDPEKLIPKANLDRIKELQNSWDKVNKELSKQTDAAKQIKEVTRAIEQQAKVQNRIAKDRAILEASDKQYNEKLQQNAIKRAELQEKLNAKLTQQANLKATGQLGSEEWNKLSTAISGVKTEISQLDASSGRAQAGLDKNANAAVKLTAEFNTSTQEVQKLTSQLQQLQNIQITPEGLQVLRQELANLTNTNIDKIPADLKELQEIINNLKAGELGQIAKKLSGIGAPLGQVGTGLGNVRRQMDDVSQSAKGFMTAAQEVDHLRTRLSYFFSIGNSIQLFKRAIRGALNTVKELDAVMTETAVVTDFTVGDMWDKLPQYAEQANALGASIKDLYSATTLYYQQGLQSNAAMGVGVETMKMARIANMEAAEATQAMTAALRGFNMEVNEMNAQVVNDVYSELAAITAADTSQIATAMTKTASIASSANMEFETTAALLAQIIETTQEAPETAGTAMKTIIARFTEVKQLFSEGMLTGEDEEGEAININKIDAALKTVGISLKDFLTGSKGIDDIFLELASKWDTLDLATQRYIATTAAGSRQQSRFIAMMSNYDRTMELVEAAQSSAGASQEQFNKTLDSMEAKLQKLSNAWNQFLMGLANNDILKGGVDLLTKLLETINNLTNALSGGNGLGKSFLSLMTVIGALMGGKALLGGVFKWAGTQMGMIQPQTTGRTNIFTSVFPNSSAQAEAAGIRDGQAYANGVVKGARRVGKSAASSVPLGTKMGFGLGGTALWGKGLSQKEFDNYLSTLTKEKMVQPRDPDTKKWVSGPKVSAQVALDDADVENIKQIMKEVENGSKTWDQANAKLKQYGTSMEQLTNKVPVVTYNLAELGMAAMAAGTAFNLLGNLFSKMGPAGEKVGQVFTVLGTVLISVGSIATMLGPILDKLGIKFSKLGIMGGKAGETIIASWGKIGAIAGWVAAIAAVIVGLGVIIAKTSIEGRLKTANETLNELSDIAEKTRNEFKELNNSILELENRTVSLENLTIGTRQWREEVSAINQEVLSLVDNFPQLATFVKSKDGVLTFDQTGLIRNQSGQTFNQVMDSLEKSINTLDIASLVSKNAVLEIQIEEALSQYGLNTAGAAEVNALEPEFQTSADQSRIRAISKFLEDVSTGKLLLDSSTTETAKKQNEQKIKDNLIENGIYTGDPALIQSVVNALSSKNISDLITAGSDLSQFTSQQELYKDLITSSLVQSIDGMSSEVAEAIEGFDDSLLYNKMASDIKERTRSVSGSKKAYALEFGEEADPSLSNKAIKQAIATSQIEKEYAVKLQLFNDILSKMEPEQLENFSQFFSEAGSELTIESLSNLKNFTIENEETGKQMVDFDSLLTDQLGITMDQAVDIFGKSAEEIKELITNNITTATYRLAKEQIKLNKAFKGTKFGEKEFKLSSLLLKTSQDYKNLMQKSFDIFSATGDQRLAVKGMEFFIDGESFKNLSEKEIEGIDDLLESINWNDPILAVKKLNEAAASGVSVISDYAKHLLEVGKVKFGAGAQFKQLLVSEDFNELNQEINEFIEKNGEISADNIRSWRDECASLNDVMEQTGVTATGMAKALTLIKTEQLGLHQMTNAVVASFAALNSMGDLVYDTVKEFEDLDFGIDESTINEAIKSMSETVTGNLDEGLWGATQSRNIIEYMFGSNALKDAAGEYLAGAEYIEAQRKYAEILANNQESMYEAWKGLATGQTVTEQGQGIQGGKLYNPETDEYDGATVTAENGQIYIDGYQNLTPEQLSKQVAASYGISEAGANAMLTDYYQRSPDAMQWYQQANFEQAMDLFVDNLNSTRVAVGRGKAVESSTGAIIYQDRTTVDESEIAAIMKAWNLEGEEGRQKVIDSLGISNLAITDFYEDGKLKSNKELIENLNTLNDDTAEANSAWIESYMSKGHTIIDAHTRTGEKWIDQFYTDYDEAMQALADLGIPESARNQLILDMTNAVTEGAEQGFINYTSGVDGETYTIEVTPEMSAEELQAKINQIDLAAEGMAIGEAIAAVLGEMSFTADVEQLKEQIETAINESGGTPTVTFDTQGIQDALASIIAGQTYSANVILNPIPGGSDTGSDTGSGASTGTTIQGSAIGVKDSPKSFLSLTGEEGPELVQTANGAYLVGQNGPEMAYINRGDTVYTAEETKAIFKGGNRPTFKRFEGGRMSAYGDPTNSGSSGGASVSKEDEEKWENSIDKLYNLLRDIDEEMRIREALERRYTKILESLNTTAKALIDVSFAELEQLEKQRGLNQERISGRQQQIQQYQRENSQYNKYAWSETDEHGNMVLRINWDAINNITDEEEGSAVEEYLSQLEDWFDDMYEAEDNIIDIDEQIREINERGKQEYFDLEGQIRDALVNERQKEIDKLDEINTSINDTNSKLLDAMQDSIDQQRKVRENEKTEKDLADKQRRLIYLQQDTSGASDLEILALQKEIDEASEDYTDTLIDQKISELQKQNEEAAEQREKQIEILQAQLDNWLESGEIWKKVYELMGSGISEEGIVIDGSALMNLLKTDAQYASMSNLEKLTWGEDLRDSVAQALHWLQVGRQLENLQMGGQRITFTTKDGKSISGIVQNDGSVIDETTGKVYHDVYQSYDGSFKTEEDSREASKPVQSPTSPPSTPSTPTAPQVTEAIKKGVAAAIWNGNQGWGTDPQRTNKLNQVFGSNIASDIVKNYVNTKNYAGNPSDFSYSKMMAAFGITEPAITGGSSNNTSGGKDQVYYTGDEVAQYNKDNGTDMSNWVYDPLTGKWRKPIKYATGGLADFTGPAWLDGTKSRPEYVLNADQTRAFFTLVDVLESLRLGTSKSSENNGDTNYDIDINVESIGSDYDVEQMAGTIKRLINEDARYRNNNAVNLMR